jgi:hypothetical protein
MPLYQADDLEAGENDTSDFTLCTKRPQLRMLDAPHLSDDATTNPLLPSPLGMASAFSLAGASVSMSAIALL